MIYEELKNAAKIFVRLHEIGNYVSKERFFLTAKCQFGIDDEKVLEIMYGYFGNVKNLPYAIAYDKGDISKYLSKAIEIADAAYGEKDTRWDTLPTTIDGGYYNEEVRRYFYRREGSDKTEHVDISLRQKNDIKQLAKLFEDETIDFRAVAPRIGKIRENGNDPEMPYFEGDIVFVYGNPTDRIFFSWYDSDAGVYVATKDEGWRKLMYTPGRGYITNDGELDYEDDRHYSDYKINKSGNGFRFIGNIHDDISVLKEKKKEK